MPRRWPAMKSHVGRGHPQRVEHADLGGDHHLARRRCARPRGRARACRRSRGCAPASAATSPAATYSITLVEQPHSGWIRNSAPGCARARGVDVVAGGCRRGRGTRRPTRACCRPALARRRRRGTCRGRTGSRVGAVVGVDVATTVDRVGRGAAVVGQRLDRGGGVDVHDDDRAGMLVLPGAQLRRR